MNKNSNLFLSARHPYHLVSQSPWPLVGSIAALILTSGGVLYMHTYTYGGYILIFGAISVIFVMIKWWGNVIHESTVVGYHNSIVKTGLRYGVILFITTEVMFFFAFFWAFFASAISPVVEIGAVWPPKGITVFNPWEVPLINTIILLTSGVTLTWSHHAIIANRRKQAIRALLFTVILGAAFTCLQAMEYLEAPFTISDGIYGSSFYMATGFHGIHVLIGTTFLIVCLFRLIKYHFTSKHHVGFEAAAWYWHFVDVVWLFLFASIYWWGGSPF